MWWEGREDELARLVERRLGIQDDEDATFDQIESGLVEDELQQVEQSLTISRQKARIQGLEAGNRNLAAALKRALPQESELADAACRMSDLETAAEGNSKRIAELEASLLAALESHATSLKYSNREHGRLLDALKKLEWAPGNRCYVCDEHRSYGHEKGCWLGALLEGSE